MKQNVIIGQYVPVDSKIHNLDSRSKLIAAFSFVLIVFIANNPITYTLLAIFTLAAISFSKIPIKFLWNGLKPIIWVILFTLMIHILFTKGGEIIWEIGPLSIHEEGIRQGVYLSLRFLLLIIITSLLTLTTTPIEITDGIESLLGPLKRFNFPVHELALMMSISLRFIPTLMQETEKIIKAQTARGVDFTSGPIKDRMKSFVPLLVPLFISAFKRAEDLAIAMEARGYRGGEGRTKFRELTWTFKDHILIVILVGLTVSLFILRS